MDAKLFNKTFLAFNRRVPFQPFTVAMLNGNQFEVDHPNALIVRGGAALFVAPGNVPVVFDHESVSQIIGDLMERQDDRPME